MASRNIPRDYLSIISNTIRLVVYDSTTGKYITVIGFEGGKDFTYDVNGNLTQITMRVIKEDGTVITVKRTFTYDAQGNLISISDWMI